MAQEGLEHIRVPTGDEANDDPWQDYSQAKARHGEHKGPVDVRFSSIFFLKYHLALIWRNETQYQSFHLCRPKGKVRSDKDNRQVSEQVEEVGNDKKKNPSGEETRSREDLREAVIYVLADFVR